MLSYFPNATKFEGIRTDDAGSFKINCEDYFDFYSYKSGETVIYSTEHSHRFVNLENVEDGVFVNEDCKNIFFKAEDDGLRAYLEDDKPITDTNAIGIVMTNYLVHDFEYGSDSPSYPDYTYSQPFGNTSHRGNGWSIFNKFELQPMTTQPNYMPLNSSSVDGESYWRELEFGNDPSISRSKRQYITASYTDKDNVWIKLNIEYCLNDASVNYKSRLIMGMILRGEKKYGKMVFKKNQIVGLADWLKKQGPDRANVIQYQPIYLIPTTVTKKEVNGKLVDITVEPFDGDLVFAYNEEQGYYCLPNCDISFNIEPGVPTTGCLYLEPLFRGIKYTGSGIENIDEDLSNERPDKDVIYDLTGRIISGDNLQPGIYIRNGRKFMVGNR